ncbi:MAG TPA: peptidoglycan-binding protein [Thermosynechococcaceae cyanobacterium]
MGIEKIQLQAGDGIDTPHLSAQVEILQQRLKDWGVLPTNAKVDGKFGTATKAAVERFQSLRPADPARSQFVPTGLSITGIVDQDTWAEILKVSPSEIKILSRDAPQIFNPAGFPAIDDLIQKAATPPELRSRARITIPIILSECISSGVSDRGQIAYVLATAEHESHLGELMTELADGWDYEPPGELARILGNTEAGDGPRYKGRGFVQVTGRRNYEDWENRLGIDLLSNPEQATIPSVAAKILVQGMRDGRFTTLSLNQFIVGDDRDFEGGRAIVNGRDRALHIARIADQYFSALT